jgi:hypothetical protein
MSFINMPGPLPHNRLSEVYWKNNVLPPTRRYVANMNPNKITIVNFIHSPA